MEPLYYWCAGSGRIGLRMTLEQAQSVSHAGDCDDDVAMLARVPEIAAQLDALDPAMLAAELCEYGAWDAEELADHDANLQRVVWLAGGDISDSPEDYRD